MPAATSYCALLLKLHNLVPFEGKRRANLLWGICNAGDEGFRPLFFAGTRPVLVGDRGDAVQCSRAGAEVQILTDPIFFIVNIARGDR